MGFRIFVSSVQREFAAERKALAEYIRGDAILGASYGCAEWPFAPMVEYAFSAPIWENEDDGFTLTIKRPDAPARGKTTIETNRETTPETAHETAQETAQEKLSELEAKIAALIRSTATITRAELAEKLGVSPDSVKRRLEALKNKVGLRHEGPTKKGRWVFDSAATNNDGKPKKGKAAK